MAHRWGENVEGVFKFPINTGATDLNKRIVYSPRIYGPDVYDMEVRRRLGVGRNKDNG